MSLLYDNIQIIIALNNPNIIMNELEFPLHNEHLFVMAFHDAS